jgi:hypothetical protein
MGSSINSENRINEPICEVLNPIKHNYCIVAI